MGFSNRLMRRGNKMNAYRILYEVLIHLENPGSSKTIKVDSITPKHGVYSITIATAVLEHSIRAIIPTIKLVSLRMGGTVYKVPTSLRLDERISTSIRWLIRAARNRQENGIVARLVREILEAICGYGEAINKKKEVHRIAEANKAFARYRLCFDTIEILY